jgi:hypothetical protein
MAEFFEPHGGTALEVRGRVLVYRSLAHMNREEVRRLEQETDEHVRRLGGQRWGVLRLIEMPVLLTPDAEEAARKAVAHMATRGLSAQAVVFLSQEDRALIEAQTARLINGVIPLKFFDEPAEAEAWLESALGEG